MEWPPFEVEPADKAGGWATTTLYELCKLYRNHQSTIGIRMYPLHYCYPHGMPSTLAQSWMDSGVGPLLDAALLVRISPLTHTEPSSLDYRSMLTRAIPMTSYRH